MQTPQDVDCPDAQELTGLTCTVEVCCQYELSFEGGRRTQARCYEMKSLRKFCTMTRMDYVMNEEVRCRVGLSDGLGVKVLN